MLLQISVCAASAQHAEPPAPDCVNAAGATSFRQDWNSHGGGLHAYRVCRTPQQRIQLFLLSPIRRASASINRLPPDTDLSASKTEAFSSRLDLTRLSQPPPPRHQHAAAIHALPRRPSGAVRHSARSQSRSAAHRCSPCSCLPRPSPLPTPKPTPIHLGQKHRIDVACCPPPMYHDRTRVTYMRRHPWSEIHVRILECLALLWQSNEARWRLPC